MILEIPEEKLFAFKKFTEIFEQYNTHTNLMSKNDLPKIWTKHIPDSLGIKFFFDKYGKAENIIDIGSGGGFPSIPVAIMYENTTVTAIESISKKVKFLNLVKNELKLENFIPICERIEKLHKQMKNSADVVTGRAVADLSKIIEYSSPFLKKGGYIVAFKSKNADFELEGAKKIINKAKVSYVEKIKYPLKEGEERYLMIFRKL